MLLAYYVNCVDDLQVFSLCWSRTLVSQFNCLANTGSKKQMSENFMYFDLRFLVDVHFLFACY